MKTLEEYTRSLRELEGNRALWERVEDEIARLKSSTDPAVLTAFEMEDYEAIFRTAFDRATASLLREVLMDPNGNGKGKGEYTFRFSTPEKAERFVEVAQRYGQAGILSEPPYTVVLKSERLPAAAINTLRRKAEEIEGVQGHSSPRGQHTKRFKAGDKVRVRWDVLKVYGTVPEMGKYAGKTATIVSISPEGYRLDIDEGEWLWDDDMLEPAHQSPTKPQSTGGIEVVELIHPAKTRFETYPKGMVFVVLGKGPTMQLVPVDKYLLGIDTLEKAEKSYDLVELPAELFRDVGRFTTEELERFFS